MDEDQTLPTRSVASVYRGVGQGAFAGTIASVLCHWVWGLALLVFVFVYGFSLQRLRSWPELAAILTMLGTTVASFAVYDVIMLDRPGPWLTTVMIAGVVVAWYVYCTIVAARVSKAWARAWTAIEAGADPSRAEQWEERWFAQIRARIAAGHRLDFLFSRRAAAALACMPLALWAGKGVVSSLILSFAFFESLVFGRMAHYLRRLRQPGAPEAQAADGRPATLFLRPFGLDMLPVDSMGTLDVMSWLDKRTFEEHVADAFQEWGPVLAIGRPGEDLPPLGASREYVADDVWQELVLRRAREARTVVIEIGDTAGLVWELENVTRLVGLRNVILLLPPGDAQFQDRTPEWAERWTTLRGAFPYLPAVTDEAAAVIYDAHERPVVVPYQRSSIPRTLTTVKATWAAARTTD